MRHPQKLLGSRLSVVGRARARRGQSVHAGGTHALAGEFAGIDDFEVVAWLAILPEERRNDR